MSISAMHYPYSTISLHSLIPVQLQEILIFLLPGKYKHVVCVSVSLCVERESRRRRGRGTEGEVKSK